MKNIAASLRQKIRAFGAAERGVAAVEFALILPFLLTLYLGSVEVGSAIAVDKRVANVAGALGDLVARQEDSITTSTLTDYFEAAQLTMAPYSGSSLKQVVSSVYVSSTGVVTVIWSRGHNGGTAHSVGATYPLAQEMIDISLNSYVIVAEAQTTYRPLAGYVFPNPFTLYHEYYYAPRFGSQITLS